MASDRKAMRKEKDTLLFFDSQVKDIRQQLNEQLKCLDVRMETQVSLVMEIQDFFRKRAEVELEYSRSLDKLSKGLMLRHKTEKQKRDQWHLFSSYACWQHLIATTRRQSRDHAVLSEIYSNNFMTRFSHIMEDVQRIYKRCRDIGTESHDELLKVLHELHTTMKTYHTYHAEERQAESKLRYVEAQKCKLEQTISKEKLERSKKFKLIVKEIQKRQSKYNEAKLKSLKARNDYVLCMDTANAAIHKYFVDDLSDIFDCIDFGFHTCLARTLMMYVSAEECLKKSCQSNIDGMNKCITSLDSRVDKQRFLEYNNSAFMVPKKFEFQPHKGDEINEVTAEKCMQEELDQRYKQVSKRLTTLKTESEEIWKTLETAEHSLLDMISTKDYDCTLLFEEDSNKNGLRQPETVSLKLRADRQETEDFYLNKFREYMMSNNLIARLQSKSDLMRKALGYEGEDKAQSTGSLHTIHRPHSLPHKARKKRIGRTPLVGQPKLFGGSLEEYLESTSQELPLIILSCIRVINLYGLHHQGIFRVSGSQLEINNFRETFERGEDPLADVSDASDINSVAGVLKLYLRELREPLFPIFYFDQLVEISQLESKQEFINKVRDVVHSLPRPVFIVLRYLFAFLNHLSEFSDENMMDPYNLAICFGPTLLPIPEDKDQVQYQNLVNELVKNIITYQEEIFPTDGGIIYEKYISSNMPDDIDVGESPPDQVSDQIDDSEVDVLPSEDDAVFPEREISLNLFGKGESLEGVAQFDFSARSERELSFKKGDTLLLHSQVSNDWWKGTFNGLDGLIPDKYILLKIKDEDKDKSSIDGSEKRRTSSSSDSLSGVSASPKSLSTTCIAEEKGAVQCRQLRTRSPSSPSPSSHLSSSYSSESHSRRRSLSPSSLNSLQPQVLEWECSKMAHSLSIDESLEGSVSAEDLNIKDLPLPVIPPPEIESVQDYSNTIENRTNSESNTFSLGNSEMSEICKRKEVKLFNPCKDTPDLVMDLPVNPSSPTTGTKLLKDSPEERISGEHSVNFTPRSTDSPELTAAECFAMSNQCTMKKGTMSRSASHVTGMPQSSDAQTQTFHAVRRSASIGVDLGPSSSPDLSFRTPRERSVKQIASEIEQLKCSEHTKECKLKQTNAVNAETVEISWRSPHKKVEVLPQTETNEILDPTSLSVGAGISTFKPQVKVKPPVLKKSSSSVQQTQGQECNKMSC